MELLKFSWNFCPAQYAIVETLGRNGGVYIVPNNEDVVLDDPSRYGLSIFRNFIDADPSAEGALRFSNIFGFLLEGDEIRVDDWLLHQKKMRSAWEKGEVGDWTGLAVAFNQPSLGVIATKIASDENDESDIKLVLEPTSLLQMMWVELALYVTNKSGLRQCDWCGSWFPYGTGTSRRKTARFCSDKCRKANHLASKDSNRKG
jgi:hypothetical protein